MDTGRRPRRVARPYGTGAAAAVRRTLHGLTGRLGGLLARVPSPVGTAARRAYLTVMILFLFVPQLVVIPLSFTSGRQFVFPPPGFSLRWYENFASPEWLQPTLVSVVVAVVSAAVAVLLGGLAAYGLVRGVPARLVAR
ncbi:hypothetical protein BJF78_19455 [Pseudonocardia sp. CNS-139]|nr:hypothetical protein BJF78_19455 [Pseudonocardia sp. CNS-139]